MIEFKLGDMDFHPALILEDLDFSPHTNQLFSISAGRHGPASTRHRV